jgi:hypothetical protein
MMATMAARNRLEKQKTQITIMACTTVLFSMFEEGDLCEG